MLANTVHRTSERARVPFTRRVSELSDMYIEKSGGGVRRPGRRACVRWRESVIASLIITNGSGAI